MTTTYVFDPTGLLGANKIVNEPHSVTQANGINAYLIAPVAGPFYRNGFSIVNASGMTLTENVDYYLTHHWQQASDYTGLDVYGSITLLTGYSVGLYRINYQTIGGAYVTAPATVIADGIAAANGSFLTIDWSTAPVSFPAIPHNHSLDSLAGMTQIYQAMNNIAVAITSPQAGIHYDDIVDIEAVNVKSNVEPILDMISSNHSNVEGLSSLVLSLKDQLSMFNTSIPGNLQNYTFPLPFGFKLKIGQLYFTPGNEPSTLYFQLPNFTNDPLFIMGNLNIGTDGATPLNDQVLFGKPTTSNVTMLANYDQTDLLSMRLLSYIVIGK